jgi:hypothetical protein
VTGTHEAVTVPKYFGSARDKQGTYVTRNIEPRRINTLHNDKLTDTYSYVEILIMHNKNQEMKETCLSRG